MRYECLPCPVCGSIFGENDDVVVCPKCGTPHHRSCWANIGRCANGEKHAQGFVWVSPLVDIPQKPNIEAPQMKPVDNEDTKGSTDEAFPFDKEEIMKMGGFRPIDGDELIGDLKVKDYGEYVDKNKHKYIPKFYRMGKTNQKVAWNWAAFFFPIPWLFYRKMNAIGAILAVFTVIIPIVFAMDVIDYTQEVINLLTQSSAGSTSRDIAALLPEPPLSYNVTRYIGFAVSLFCGMFGNYFYMKKATKDIKAIKADEQDFNEYKSILRKKGSASIGRMILGLLILYVAMEVAFSVSTRTGIDISMYVEKIIMYFQK